LFFLCGLGHVSHVHVQSCFGWSLYLAIFDLSPYADVLRIGGPFSIRRCLAHWRKKDFSNFCRSCSKKTWRSLWKNTLTSTISFIKFSTQYVLIMHFIWTCRCWYTFQLTWWKLEKFDLG
jgi:hypothetical protein